MTIAHEIFEVLSNTSFVTDAKAGDETTIGEAIPTHVLWIVSVKLGLLTRHPEVAKSLGIGKEL